jgi:hypothetical protein
MQKELGTMNRAEQSSEVGIVLGDQNAARPRQLWRGQLDELMMFERVLRGVQIVDIYQWGITARPLTTPTTAPQPTPVAPSNFDCLFCWRLLLTRRVFIVAPAPPTPKPPSEMLLLLVDFGLTCIV